MTPSVTRLGASAPWLFVALILAATVGAIASLPKLLCIAAIVACGAVLGVFWVEVGLVFYVVGLFVILFLKRMTDQPIGLAFDAYILLLAIGLMLRFCRPESANEYLRWHHPLVAVVLLFEGFQVVDAFNPAGSLGWVFSTYAVRQTLPTVTVFMLTVLLVSTRDRIARFMALWLGLTAVVALYAIKQQFFGFYWRETVWMYSPDGQVWTTAEGVRRVFSTLNPDTAGLTMAFGMTLCFALLFSPIRARFKFILATMLPLCGAAMLFTGTRGAYAAALVGIAVVIILLGRWLLYLIAPLAVGAAATMIDWTANYWGVRFLSVFDPQHDSSYQVRQRIIGQYFNGALNRPFGLGTATTSYADFAQNQFRAAEAGGNLLANGTHIATDNNYFLAVLELGSVGVLLLILVLSVCLFFAGRFAFTVRDPFLRCVGIGLCGCCAGATVASFSNNYLTFWGTWVIFGLVCALDQIAHPRRVHHGHETVSRLASVPNETGYMPPPDASIFFGNDTAVSGGSTGQGSMGSNF